MPNNCCTVASDARAHLLLTQDALGLRARRLCLLHALLLPARWGAAANGQPRRGTAGCTERECRGRHCPSKPHLLAGMAGAHGSRSAGCLPTPCVRLLPPLLLLLLLLPQLLLLALVPLCILKLLRVRVEGGRVNARFKRVFQSQLQHAGATACRALSPLYHLYKSSPPCPPWPPAPAPPPPPCAAAPARAVHAATPRPPPALRGAAPPRAAPAPAPATVQSRGRQTQSAGMQEHGSTQSLLLLLNAPTTWQPAAFTLASAFSAISLRASSYCRGQRRGRGRLAHPTISLHSSKQMPHTHACILRCSPPSHAQHAPGSAAPAPAPGAASSPPAAAAGVRAEQQGDAEPAHDTTCCCASATWQYLRNTPLPIQYSATHRLLLHQVLGARNRAAGGGLGPRLRQGDMQRGGC